MIDTNFALALACFNALDKRLEKLSETHIRVPAKLRSVPIEKNFEDTHELYSN